MGLPDSALSAGGAEAPFDIVGTYQRLLTEDPDLTMPVAAIEALVAALSASDTSTTTETLALLSAYTNKLKAAIPNPISLSAGTDLFQRYLMTSVRPGVDFSKTRQHLLSNGRLFVERAKASRDKIASFGKHFIRDGNTILTNGGSRVVSALLRSAAESAGGSQGSVRFRVIYVLAVPDPANPSTEATTKHAEGTEIVRALRAHGVPVATIPEAGVAYAMGKVDMVIVGAEGVVENGGIISRLGTYQLGVLAKNANKPFYVVAESHKFVRLYPLGQYDLPIEQKVIQFRVGHDERVVEEEGSKSSGEADLGVRKEKWAAGAVDDAVDFTPPNLISALITESGVLTPSAVSEELIKIWF
ncbi:translation initiation factor eIF-2B subunit alpha [Diplodia seriata]|uniref:Translation initiation factor eIF2B subunit alpha n=2 Tax=Diplodia TaxID=66735 RepID=A0A0G2EXH2_9PEZI|nr:putative translation initiation factor eif-2b alpha [Diplodia seriata]OMP86359.1 Translation initiation factor eIF-2B subunit alpha [Diplodia seriata]